MEARIDPLQFGGVEGWSAGDRERKMAEYQVGGVRCHMVWYGRVRYGITPCRCSRRT